MKLDRCGRLAQHPLSGHWYRAIDLAFLPTRLSIEHTAISRSRFSLACPTNPLRRLLYLAENHQVAIYEVGALLGPPTAPIPDPKVSWLLLSLEVKLGRVVDLCDEGQRAIVGTTFQELTGNWLDSPGPVPTHELGMALQRLPKLEGFLFPSARVGGRNLVVFPDKLDRRSSVVFRNDLERTVERLT